MIMVVLTIHFRKRDLTLFPTLLLSTDFMTVSVHQNLPIQIIVSDTTSRPWSFGTWHFLRLQISEFN